MRWFNQFLENRLFEASISNQTETVIIPFLAINSHCNDEKVIRVVFGLDGSKVCVMIPIVRGLEVGFESIPFI